MCGIAGIVDRSESDLAGALGRMLARIAHRGPDGEGTHISKPDGLAIGMRRLSIIDLKGGAQPIWNEDGTIAVVFNGEIYNYVELRTELEGKGHRFCTHSDTEVLLHLYEEMGADMSERLRGMFAFCILDQARRRLLLARDHFGQKPLYWTKRDGRFAFGSELKCLLALPWVNRELRPEAFLEYAAWLSLPPVAPAGQTHFAEIRKLQPGQWLQVELDAPGNTAGVREWRYDLSKKPDLTDPDDAADALDAVLKDSVRVHLRADVPVGVLLSSGLDSRDGVRLRAGTARRHDADVHGRLWRGGQRTDRRCENREGDRQQTPRARTHGDRSRRQHRTHRMASR